MLNSSILLTNEPEASEADTSFVRQGLRRYNLLFAEDDSFQPLNLFLRRDDGSIAGGLLGDIYWGWLSINILWIDDRLRRQGYGERLIKRAEEEALKKGCQAVHLDTMSFQARPFYERLGYTVFGVLDDLPVGHQRIFMWKKLI
ncbi:MAG: N-acetyltransferase [Chloroflexi bacterium HGW-Chloroflexi-4]|jgi:GNAT superfamily N-acetyltransferase|nr:MAG: N-acetyltransferase [Chloroflexi bacterium HGW-Chloroflexi-4]